MRLLLALGIALLVADTAALGQTALGALELSFDIATPYGPLSATAHDVVQEDFSGYPTLAVRGLPVAANLASYHRDPDGARLLVFDTTVTLPGGVTATPRDVVRWAGASFALLLQGGPAGIPAGAAIDVVTRALDGSLVLSFDVDVALGGITYANDDLVLFDGKNFSLFFDPAAAGLDPALDVDAADVLWNGRILLALDGSGTINGIDFTPRDVLEVGQDGSNWQMARQLSSKIPELGAARIDALQALQVAPGLPFGDGFEAGNCGHWTWYLP